MAALVFQTLFSSSSAEREGVSTWWFRLKGFCRQLSAPLARRVPEEVHPGMSFSGSSKYPLCAATVLRCVGHTVAVFWAYYRRLKGATRPLLPESRGKSLRS
uniref:Putative secreted protein n=1 Tax=Anopheles darlingi TaxID=43151 RepID=A0A2M4D652_ANODA